MSNSPVLSAAEIAAHGAKDDLWLSIHGKGQ